MTYCHLGRHCSLVFKITQLIRPEKYKCSKCGPIHNIKITTKILQGVSPLSSLWPFRLTQFSINTNHSINYLFSSVWGFPLDGGGWLVLLLNSLLWFFEKFRVFSPKPILVLRIVEYSKSSMLDYFKYTLANVGLPEAWLKLKSNYMTQIKNKFVKRKSNWIKGTESNPVENCELNQVGNNELNQVRHGDSNQVGNGGQCGTSDADYGTSVGYLMQQWEVSLHIGGLLAVILTLAEMPGP